MQNIGITVGVDGGGTSCRAALCHGPVRLDAVGAAANVSDFDRAIDTICTTVEDLVRRAGLPGEALGQGALHLGLAGVTGPTMAARVGAALQARLGAGHITVSGDHVTTIAGALGASDGAVAGIGTGSFLGRQIGGRVQALGGHGFLLGDEASGAWLGKRILQDTLLAEDGLLAHSGLTREMLDDHGDRAGIIAFALSARPADFARLAPRVLTAAGAGDVTAARLMRQGADYILAALRALGWSQGEALCLAGGLGPAYRDWLPDPVAQSLIAPRGGALDGALALAGRGLAA